MPRIRATAVGAITLAVSLAAIPSAVANPDDGGKLTVTPSSVRPGERVKLYTVNPELDGGETVQSEAFAKAVELKSTGKVSFEAHARVRCDAEPGTYDLRFDKPVLPGEGTRAGKVTVEAGGPADGSGCGERAGGETEDGGSGARTVGIAAGAVAVVAAGAFFAVRRRRRA